jgi:hypothetical protein
LGSRKPSDTWDICHQELPRGFNGMFPSHRKQLLHCLEPHRLFQNFEIPESNTKTKILSSILKILERKKITQLLVPMEFGEVFRCWISFQVSLFCFGIPRFKISKPIQRSQTKVIKDEVSKKE